MKHFAWLQAAVVVSLELPTVAELVTYDVGDYVQDGLVAHFDGIRNVGAECPHAADAPTWLNLVEGAPDFCICNESTGVARDGWTENGFSVVSNIWLEMTKALPLPACFSVQYVGDVNTAVAHRSNDPAKLYPSYLATKDSHGECDFYTRWTGSSVQLEWRTDAIQRMTAGKDRPTLVGWNGLNYTAIIDEEECCLFSGDSRKTGDARVREKVEQIGAYVWGVGMHKAGDYDGFRGVVHAVRFYNRPLSDEEVALNNRIDRFRFRDERERTNVVVRSSRPDVSGAERGNCQVKGEHVFTAPASCENLFGTGVFACRGYMLESWDERTQTWGEAQRFSGTSYAYAVGRQPDKVRLTWLWEQTSGLVIDEPWDYVQDGFVVQYDAIRNRGAALPHGNYPAWANLADPHVPAYILEFADDTGGWQDDAYGFRGRSSAFMNRSVRLGGAVTAEVVAEMWHEDQQAAYPMFFDTDQDDFALYEAVGLGQLYFKFAGTRVGMDFTDWDHRFLTASFDGSRVILRDSVHAHSADQGGNVGIGDLQLYLSGGDKVALARYPVQSCINCNYHSLRIYNRCLSDAELAHNREVDARRFYGAAGVTNVIVSSLCPAREAHVGDGSYEVLDAHTFRAPSVRIEKEGRVYVLDGYRLDRWDEAEGEWVPIGRYQGDSYSYSATDDKLRLTWLWRRGGGLVSTYDVDDYVQDGIVHNFDAIRNVGVDRPHDPVAETWLDASGSGSTFAFERETGSSAGWRHGDRYAFARSAGAKLSAKLLLPESATVQCVLADMNFDTTMTYPTFFGRTDDNICLFTRGSGRTLEWKHYDSARKCLEDWRGEYIDAIMTGTKFFLSQNGHRGDASVKSYAAAYRNLLHDINIGAEFRTESDRLKTHADCSYHAVRVYHRALTDWELQHNRMIDDVRFRGVIPVTNVVVATSLPGAEGEERSGYYQVGEKYVFTAVPQTVDGRRYRPIGYELEVWNATRGAWGEKTRGCGASYTYETGVAPEKVRLTWLWGDGFLVQVR